MGSRTRGASGARRAAMSLLAALLLVGLVPAAAAAQPADPRAGLAPGTDGEDPGGGFTVPNADAGIAASGMELLANRPKPAWAANAGAFNYSNINSDLAFTGDHAISGNYLGFGIYDISDPNNPVLSTTVNCPGGQGDVSVHGDLLFVSVESKRSSPECTSTTMPNGWSGVRIFDISDLAMPQYVSAVATCRGSHTHTVVEDPDDPANVYIYVSGTAAVRGGATQWTGDCTNTVTSSNDRDLFLDANGDPVPTDRFQVEVIKVPVADPAGAAIVNEARLMADPATGNPHGLWEGGNYGAGTQSTPATDACHDITAYPEIGLAAGACEGNGMLIDISDPANPMRIDEVADPNFAYWHSATINNDGTKVVFTDEWGGGVGARCRPTDPDNWGADAIFDIVQTPDGPQMELASYYKIPNVQSTTETCVAHNGSLVPVPGRDVMVQAWYEGGVSVMDFTDSANPVELAYFDRGPYHPEIFHQGGYWSAYYYNGHVYGNEIFLGFDSFGLTASDLLSQDAIDAAGQVQVDEFNAQAQEEIVWAPSFQVVRARIAPRAASGELDARELDRLEKFVDRAEQFSNGPQRKAAPNQLRAAARQLDDTAGQDALGQSMLDLADTLR